MRGVENSCVASIHSSGQVSNWDTVTDLRQSAEDSFYRIINRLIDDRHALEDKIRLLERQLREARKQHG
jgi:hypothetical protein